MIDNRQTSNRITKVGGNIDTDSTTEPQRHVIVYGLIPRFGFIDCENDKEIYLASEIAFARNIAVCRAPSDLLTKLEPQQEPKLSEDMKEEISSCISAVKIVLFTTKEEESTKLKGAIADIHSFVSTLRIIKSNLANLRYVFTYYPDEDRYFFNTQYSLPSCYSFDMNIDNHSIELLRFDVKLKPDVGEIWDNLPMVQSSRNRISMALEIYESAYHQHIDEVRILLFTIALECLFSTESTNLMHNLASRTARFLTDDVKRREKIYRRITSAYNIRSVIVHGLKETIAYCQYRFAEKVLREMVRKNLRKVLGDVDFINVFVNSDQKGYHSFLRNLGSNATTNLVYDENNYWMSLTNKDKIGPYCPRCWRKEKIPVKMCFRNVTQKWRCPVCGNFVIL